MRRLGLSLLLASATAAAQPVPADVSPKGTTSPVAPGVRAHATRRTKTITIDGRLDEPAWASAPRQGGFTQRFPKDGAKASHDTQFALLYDDHAIYVGVWAHDPEPAKIRRTLTRRDVDALADAIAVGFDSYHDRRTAYVFQINAAGVQRDIMVFDDAAQDDTWDAVWTGDVAITPEGWTAELRIPLNQLRFADGESYDWGLQVVRMIARNQEQSAWSPWPRTSSQIVSKFGVLDGIAVTKPSRRLELLPYASGGVQTEQVEDGDPLNASTSALGNLGLDLKYGLGSAFTLSATVNPDFGQVEADPSQVNLSANELFFAEKRPFFVEGVDLFKLPIGNGNNLVEGAFYSRRIGAAPAPPDMDYAYIRAPTSTTIYSAAKLTGKTRNGWSVGVLDAVTGEETATIVDGDGAKMEPVVAPLTNYSVARVKRDLRGGNTTIGASATTVHRALAGTPLQSIDHDQAYTAGAQLTHRWANNAWELDVHGVGSYVHGTADAITNTQQLNRHLFQRPDADHVEVDPTRTSLSGLSLSWVVGRSGETKHWRWAHGGDLRTPGLELNDAGFQMYSDRIEPWLWGEYREDDPGDTILNWRAESVLFMSSTLEPRLLTYGTDTSISTQLANYWSFRTGIHVEAGGWNVTALRGGQALRTNTRVGGMAGVSTDSRKDVRVEGAMRAGRNFVADAMDFGLSAGTTIQARSNIDVFVGLDWMRRMDPLQYVTAVDDSAGRTHYVFGTIDQTVASLTTRLNWTFSPRLSLQVYAQPFIASGDYRELKDVDNPHAKRLADRFDVLEGNDYAVMDDMVYVSHNGAYSFSRPDFSFDELRSTVVLRWEYRPGSTVFAIWSHGRTHETSDGRFDLASGITDLGGQDLRDLAVSVVEDAAKAARVLEPAGDVALLRRQHAVGDRLVRVVERVGVDLLEGLVELLGLLGRDPGLLLYLPAHLLDALARDQQPGRDQRHDAISVFLFALAVEAAEHRGELLLAALAAFEPRLVLLIGERRSRARAGARGA
jgi:hypothetical protein